MKTQSNLSKEIWENIPMLEGLYQASTKGRIKRREQVIKVIEKNRIYLRHKKEKILKQTYSNRYFQISLCIGGIKKQFRAHRLIANTFIDNPKNKPQVNHIDCVKTNNNVLNLEWVTHKENDKHATKNKLHPLGEQNGKSILKEHQVIEIRNKFKPHKYTIKTLSKEFNVSIGCIRHIIYEKTWNYLITKTAPLNKSTTV